jgi:type II secretory ATPase GspE/PulE/Tfp pilus assembly ATPase PilB-like protein
MSEPRTADARSPADSPEWGAIGATDLHWPAPHHMRWVESKPLTEPERGVVTLLDGERRKGDVLAVDFKLQRLTLQPDHAGVQVVHFRDIRSVLLSRAVELERVPLHMPQGTIALKPSRNRHQCLVKMTDAAEMNVQVVALLPREQGLFLYVVHYGDTVLRWFLPGHAVASYRLGDHMKAVPMAAPSSVCVEHTGAENKDDYFEQHAVGTREGVQKALDRQHHMPRRRLGDLLMEAGLINEKQRSEALERQRADRHKLIGDILVEMGAVSRAAIRRVLVSQLGIPAVHLTRFPLDPNAIKSISAELARKHTVLPLYRTEKRLVVALENPLSWEALHELEFFTSLRLDPCLAPRAELLAAIDQFYGDGPTAGEKIGQLVERLGEESAGAPEHVPEEVVTDADNTLVRLVNKMIQDAVDQGASDIHVETRQGEKASRVRFRIDGILAPYIEVPPNFRAALVSRIKIMAGLDISEKRRPQDGKIRFEEHGRRRVELRIVTMPTAGGQEDVVMRILTAPRAISVEQLGMAPRDLEKLKDIAGRSFGLLFVCGPTGSGKTTTLHALLSFINTPERKIWTVEDPVEITQEGLCQVQVNTKLGLTFPSVLRSFLRADPDVIMVGETRDQETARTVIAASLTGHLVFSTMHTNSAVESIVRLLDFGLDAFNFSDALLGVVGQRLVRRLCHCKKPYTASTEEVESLAHEYCRETGHRPADVAARWRSRYGAGDGSLTLFSAVGCDTCDHTGYKGRMGVYELLVATPGIRSAIQARANSVDVLNMAVASGMTTLEQDAIEKIMQGHLDHKQVLASCR